MSTYSWPLIKSKLREAVLALPNFFKNPIQGMRQLPNWEWPELVILQCAFASTMAMLKSIIDRSLVGLVNVVIAPFAAVIVIGLVAWIITYAFKFFNDRDVDLRLVYTNLVFAAIPSQITNILSKYIPGVNLCGLAATLILLHVGLTHNFYANPRKLKNGFIGLFVAAALITVLSLVKNQFRREDMRQKATPESLDILEKEFNEK